MVEAKQPSGFVASSANVVIRHDGVALVRGTTGDPWSVDADGRRPLDAGELDELMLLAAGPVEERLAALTPGSPERRRADQLAEALAAFGLLSARPGRRPPTPPAPDAPLGVYDAGRPLSLTMPLVLSIAPDGYRAYSHDGRPIAHLTAREVMAATSLCRSTPLAAAADDQRQKLGPDALTDAGLAELVQRLWAAGLVRDGTDEHSTDHALIEEFRRALAAENVLRTACRDAHEQHDREEAERRRSTGVRRVKIVAVQVAGNIPPLSTGMLLASIAAETNADLADVYDPYPRWITNIDDAPDPADGPSIYLFTNYLWSHEQNLDFARAVRDRDPGALLVHGGPDCPGYPSDSERYLRDNPQVDVAVRGEGEAAIVDVLRALAPSYSSSGAPSLSALRGVPGVAFLDDEYVRTEDRPRMDDLNVVPSPYLSGVFDVFGSTRQMGMAIIETNRGCPYGCSFCDWGSATNSRIRKLDLDRVKAEFEWCARHEVSKIFIADANFGIFDRDVDIARHVVDLHAEHGYPKRFISNYAKNTVKHLKQIVGILVGGGVVSEGLLSLQSMDESTLAAIRRSNIKLDKYEALASEFSDAGMPLFVDLMIGLPGQTVSSFRSDLQQCVDRDVSAKVHATELLVNSPMNDPAYRSEFAVRSSRAPGATGEGAASARRRGPSLVVSTSTFTPDDYVEMDQIRRTYLLLENLGVARIVSRFVRRELGLPEVDLYERMRLDATTDPDEWPFLRSAVLAVPLTMAPPTSWAFYRDDLHRYLATRIGLADDSALASVLTVQHQLLPAGGRSFPVRLELEHDVAAWYRSVVAAKHAGHLHDWEQHVGRLVDHGPAVLTITDPREVCDRNLGVGTSLQEYRDWELHSEVERAMPGHHQAM